MFSVDSVFLPCVGCVAPECCGRCPLSLVVRNLSSAGTGRPCLLWFRGSPRSVSKVWVPVLLCLFSLRYHISQFSYVRTCSSGILKKKKMGESFRFCFFSLGAACSKLGDRVVRTSQAASLTTCVSQVPPCLSRFPVCSSPCTYETRRYFGGVVSFSRDDFEAINGFPNTFWGWGGEDDEMYSRIKEVKQQKNRKKEETCVIYDSIGQTRKSVL